MLIKNVSFDTVEWLSENGKLLKVRRSASNYVPKNLNDHWVNFVYPDWVDLTIKTGELFECPQISDAIKGFDVEVRSIEDDFPIEILERLNEDQI